MTSSTARDDRPSLAIFFSLAALLSILVGLAVALPDYLPTNDGPEHVFASFARRNLENPALGYGRYLKPGASFSQLGFDVLFGSCQSLLGWRNGLRASLVVMTLVWAFGVVAIAAAAGRRRIWLGLAGFAVAIQWQLYMGMFSFYLAAGLGFYLVALALWRRQWSTTWRIVLSAGLAAQALVHPVPAVCSGVVLLIVTLWRAEGARVRETALLAVMGIPAALFAVASIRSSDPGGSAIILPFTQRAGLALTTFVSGPLWRSLTVPACALAAAVIGVASRSWRRDQTSGALLVIGFLFALMATQTPHHLAGWEFFSMRFTPLACVFWLITLPVERWPRAARVAGVVLLAAFAVASNVWALRYNLKLRRESDDVLSGLQAPIRRSGLRLPLIIEPRAGEPQDKPSRTIPLATANWNLGSLYAVEQGGVPAWTFAESETIHQVVWRWPEQQGLRAPRPDRGFEWRLSEPEILSVPGARKAAVSQLLAYAPYYEDVIFYGRPEEVAWLRERRFAIDFQKGGLAIARFRPCPATFEFAPGPSGHASTLLYFGWHPATVPSFSLTLPADPQGTTNRRWPLRECPCGDVWLRVLFDNDGDGRLSQGDTTCIEATGQAQLTAHIEPGNDPIVCHPGRSIEH